MWFLNISSEFCKPLTSACPRSVQVRMWWTGSTVTSRVSPTAVKLASTQATCWRPVTSVTPSTRWPSPSSATTCSETSVEVRRITQQSTPFINIQVSEGTKLDLKMWTQLKCLELQYHQWSQDGTRKSPVPHDGSNLSLKVKQCIHFTQILKNNTVSWKRYQEVHPLCVSLFVLMLCY